MNTTTEHTYDLRPGEKLGKPWIPMKRPAEWSKGCDERVWDRIGEFRLHDNSGRWRGYLSEYAGVCVCEVDCPYRPGQILPVREEWAIDDPEKLKLKVWEGGQNPDWIYVREPVHEDIGIKWRPASTMPDWAIRHCPTILSIEARQPKDAPEEELAVANFQPLSSPDEVWHRPLRIGCDVWCWLLTLGNE